MRTFLIAALMIVGTTAAMAQFPPPGLYACTLADDTAFGDVFLQPDGDYQFTAADGTKSAGQLGSSGTDVRALTGPLFDDYHLAGAYATNEVGETQFRFESDAGQIACGPG